MREPPAGLFRVPCGSTTSEPAEFPGETATSTSKGRCYVSFGIYSIGFAIVIGGLIYAAYLVHMPGHWIAVGAVVLLGIGILSGVKATRQKDPMG